MKFTSERMIPQYNKDSDVWAEHYCRYIFAAQFVKDKVVLDIACGSGYGTYYLAKSQAKEVIGVDISEESIKYAKKKFSNQSIKYLVGKAEEIPVAKSSVDLIVSFETIEHIDQYENFLKETIRVLNDKGLCVISTPNKEIFPPGNKFHLKEFSLGEFRKLLKKYYRYVEIYDQNNWVASTILSQAQVSKNDIKNPLKNMTSYKISDKDYNGSHYFIALCANQPIKVEVQPVATFYEFTLGIDYLVNQRNDLEKIVRDKEREIQEKVNLVTLERDKLAEELNKIYHSKGWKMLTKARKLKNVISRTQ